LKYWNSEPVIERMQLISKPTRRIWMDVEGLRSIVLGRKSGYVDGLTRPGECMFVSTDVGVLEARECVERKVGGMVICRVR
jgi:ribosomal protein S8